jgi:eukaryotic-like serine/threonine-protein kinase
MKICTACGAEYGDEVLFCQRDGTPLRPSGPTTDLVGQVIADRYHITKKLGEGGMGQVYLAEHVKMGRRCAVKIMTPGMMSDPDAISRFNREAANASRISHPNVCAIYDFGETPEGLIYLAMEFIEGRSLTALLEELGTLPLARAASILTQCADALQVAHDLGIVHRDLKPDNIMVVTARGRDTVKVVDFGIAKAVGADSTDQKVTKTGFVVGTPEYMSPEQLAGDPVDGRSDIYSLGLVFYRMLTGGSPFPAESQQETMIKRLTDDPLPLAVARPDVRFPAELQRVMDLALARSPTERYASAADFGRDVRNLAGSLTGSVDVDAGTQVVRSQDKGGATIPATRVDPAVGPKPKAPAPAPAVLPARRGLPLVPVAIAAVAVAMGGGAYAFRHSLFGTKAPPVDSAAHADSSRVPAGPGGGQQSDTQRTQAAQGGNVPVSHPAPVDHGNTTPAPPKPAPDTVRVPHPTPSQPDLATLDRQLTECCDDPDFVDTESKRLAGKRLGEQIFANQNAPDLVRARAAFAVAQVYMKTQEREQAHEWMQKAAALDPANKTYQNILAQF